MSTMTRPNPFTTTASATGGGPSEKQAAYIASLARQVIEADVELARLSGDADRIAAVTSAAEQADPDDMTHIADRKAASAAIDYLRGVLDTRRAELRTARAATPTAPADELEAGMYHRDGVIYKVQRAVHGSGRMYAKTLDTTTGRFDYAAGAIRKLTTGDRMTLDQAKEYGALYGMCVRCGATLTDEESIAAAIGPICATKI